MRLATFNVLHGRSPDDDRVDVARFVGAVTDLDADVLALQEVDRHQPRSGRSDLTSVAAEAGGFVGARFLPALAGVPGAWSAARGHDPDRPEYGVALLSRYPVLSWQELRLPVLPGRVPLVFRGRPRPQLVADEPRVALVALLDTPGGVLTVVSTHLSFIPVWNVVQLRRLSAAVRRSSPLVVAGDLNLGAHSAARWTGLRALATGATFPAHRPQRQLDHLLARGLPDPVTGSVRRLPLSDHCALVADVGDLRPVRRR